MMTHDEMILVIQAHKEGKRIQYNDHSLNEWVDSLENKVFWDFSKADYRVKPEPREFLLCPTNSCGGFVLCTGCGTPKCIGAIKVREVIE